MGLPRAVLAIAMVMTAQGLLRELCRIQQSAMRRPLGLRRYAGIDSPDPPFSAVCTYKSLTSAACVGGSRPGVVYECQSVQSTVCLATLQTASSYEFSLEQGTQKTESIQLINPGTVPRTATLEVINPHSDLTVSLSQSTVSIGAGETQTLPITLDAGTTPIGVYDDLLLKVTADDGSTLYASIKVNVSAGTGQLPDLAITADDIGTSAMQTARSR